MLAEPLPAWLQPILDRVNSLGVLPGEANHVLINEYLPGQGIMAHTDGPIYAPVIVNITLQSHCVIDFAPSHGAENTSLLLLPRALLIVKDALYQGLHGIVERTEDVLDATIANLETCGMAPQVLPRGTRLSLTIRHVLKARSSDKLNMLLKSRSKPV